MLMKYKKKMKIKYFSKKNMKIRTKNYGRGAQNVLHKYLTQPKYYHYILNVYLVC